MSNITSIRKPSGSKKFRVLIVQSPYYEHISAQLLQGARAELEKANCEVEVTSVPGALEIPGTISIAYEFGDYDGFVALGCVIRGETTHYEIVSGESARGLMSLTIDGACLGNGILTVENEAQALVRANVSEMNKGAGAAQACIAMMKFRASQEALNDQ
ncbi:MAG: 6,7-dimethyl-8-ribityllumazine synthase [Anderseniella sp.]